MNAAGRTCLYLALAGTLAAVITGLMTEESFPHNAAIHHMMQTHETLAWSVLAIASVLSVWSFFQAEHRPKGAWAFLALLGLAVLIVAQGADIGARMVYLEGAAVKPAVSVIAGGEDEAAEGIPHKHEVPHEHEGHAD